MRTTVGGLTMAQAASDIGVSDECIRGWLADKDHPLFEAAVQYGPRTVRIPIERWEAFKAGRPKYTPVPRKPGAAPAA